MQVRGTSLFVRGGRTEWAKSRRKIIVVLPFFTDVSALFDSKAKNQLFFKVSVYKRLMLRKEIFFFTKVALFYTILSYHLQPTVLEASRENLSSSLTIFFSVVGKVNKCIYIRTYIYVLTMLVVV